MMESGVSGSQRNRLQTIKQIIESETGDDESVEIERVVEKAAENDIPEDKAEEVINRLKRDGELFEPEQGKIQRI
jgi:replicative DNA helicase Mcm